MQDIALFHPLLPHERTDSLLWSNLYGSSIGLAISNAIRLCEQPLLIIAPDSLFAAHLSDELTFFNAKNETFMVFPDWETLPYDHFSPHQDIISERLAVLHHLPKLRKGAVITTMSTLLQKLPPRQFLDAHSFILKIGEHLNPDILKTRLIQLGYHHVSQVREHGEFTIRGSLIDLFPMGSRIPYRIDLFDNEVDSIRLFSPDTQRSLEKIEAINLLPAKEFPMTAEAIEFFRQHWREQFSGNPLNSPIYQDISDGICSPGIEYYLPLFFTEMNTIFDYLPPNMVMITINDASDKAQEFWEEINGRYAQLQYDTLRPVLKPEQLFISENEFFKRLSIYSQITINASTNQPKKYQERIDFATTAPPALEINHKATQPLAALSEFILTAPGRTLFCSESVGRREVLTQLFSTIQFSPIFFNSWHEYLASDKKFGIVVAPIDMGFQLANKQFTLLTETQLYSKRVMQRRLRKKTTQNADFLIRDLTELKLNDPVVHIDHGVGRYLGLKTLKVGDQIGEFLTLEYQGGDKLYVPVASLHLISRYTGTDAEHTPINKLGTENWQKAKRKAAEKVKDIAAELLDLYARRAARPGVIYRIPEEQYNAFAAAFPFEETPDQLQAINAVFADMTSSKPMDRVICGDVGFGKTEVAMRAAFLAVQNNKQVIILVPTTLLAQQHFQNFQNRFADSAIQIEMLSRFRSVKVQKLILQKLAEGKVDIVIGTHKLLQDNINIPKLGLVIIDEEHRFGVKQKEKLKAIRSMVDILTLTATPIPRTLNMALAGIRDLSVIATPPAKRLAVKTFVHEYNTALIQEAIQRELMRGGQVYFLHNEVSTINRKATELIKLVPEARIAVAHGQMHERDLEDIMTAFYHRRTNVLICSTIIESGIDIPTANTIIINRADKLGIAQLHQLRGRVGRSHHQAYAYLLVPPRDQMTKDAQKRLDAIASLDDLGIGFTLATHDLEIRGAGELLGESQSGNMHEIGFSLYMDLLTRAVDALKLGQEPDFEQSFFNTKHLEIDLHLTALIPEHFLNDVELRLQFYKRIANAKSIPALDEIQVEMIDRFGLLPEPLKNLFAISEMKLKADKLGIIKIEAGEKGGKIEFIDKPHVNPETIIKLIQAKTPTYRLDGATRLRFNLPQHEKTQRFTLINDILNQLEK